MMSESKAKPKTKSVARSGPTALVPKDPQPTVDRIDELARRILNGDILLPKFQRDFVWERPQILTLLDSIGMGWPIGSILLWQSRQELRSENRIADLEIKLSKPDYPVNYLLDGQQRLSTICGSLYWDGKDERSPWNIVYDLRTEKFIHLDTLDDPPLNQVRVNKLSEPSAFFKHVASLDTLTSSDKQTLKDRADRLFNRFKDYKIASVTLGDMSIQDVAPIFERINSQGTPLTIVDLMRAATWSPDFDLIDSINGVLSDLEDKGYNTIDKKTILRNLSAATGGGFSVDSIDKLREHDAPVLKKGIGDVNEAYKRTADFLVTQIHIPTSEVLPYSNQLTVLAEIFRQIPSPTATQFSAIKTWFWQTSLAGYFGGWNTGMMASDLAAIKAFASGTAKAVDVDVSAPSSAIWKERQFRLNSAHSKLLAIVLGYLHPVDLLTGQKIDLAKALAWVNSKEFHHFFPRDYLATQNVKPSLANSLANIIFLTSASNKRISARAPSDYLKEVEAAGGKALPKWLESNLIPEDAYKAAKSDDFARFLEIRATAIQKEVETRAGW